MDNGTTQNRHRDIGKDGDQTLPGNPYQYFAGDAFGYALGYYNGPQKDYEAISQPTQANHFLTETNGSQMLANRHDLYNGNISYMVTAIPDANAYATNNVIASATLGKSYTYDQLNRIAHSKSFYNIDYTNNEWQNTTSSPAVALQTDYTYDAMGNIQTLKRYNQTQLMDDLVYHYDKTGSQLNSNKLYHVNDIAGQVGTNDLGDQGTVDTTNIAAYNNYKYDKLGNLVYDSTERIQEIKWTVYGKIAEIIRDNRSVHQKADLAFRYDATGNRVLKIVKPRDASGNLKPEADWIKTYYVRDASGNIMSTYTLNVDETIWEEVPLYGSQRLGVYMPKKLLTDGCAISSDNNLLYNSGMGDPAFDQAVTDALHDANLQAVAPILLPIVGTEIDQAGDFAPGMPEFEAYVQGMNDFLCLFSCYSIQDDADFQSIIFPEVNNLLHNSTQMPQMDIHDVNSIAYFWSNTNAAMQTVLQNTYGTCNEDVSGRILGAKHYELSNHLGNVLVTITDKKIAIANGAGTQIAYFETEITTISDYYPFGMLIQERSYTATVKGYRFGFNGMKSDNEVSGDGNSLDFGARIYDSRLGRWMSVDPLQKKFAGFSPYIFVANMPIVAVDPDGRDNVIYLLYLPNSKNKLTLTNAYQMAEQANENFKNLGLETRVIVKDMGHIETFESKYIDASDAIAVLGTKGDVVNYIRTQDKFYADQELTSKDNPWKGGIVNPERSEMYANKVKWIAIDANGVKGAGDNLGWTLKEMGGQIINHGAGHNADVSHGAYNAAHSKEGNSLQYFTYDYIVGNESSQNSYYIKAIIGRFGSNKAKDNYNLNRRIESGWHEHISKKHRPKSK